VLDARVAELARELSKPNVKLEIRKLVLKLFADKYIEFIQVALQESSATTLESRELLEPSDLFLEVLTALRAADWNTIRAINHKLLS
jgi:hypothetical protein